MSDFDPIGSSYQEGLAALDSIAQRLTGLDPHTAPQEIRRALTIVELLVGRSFLATSSQIEQLEQRRAAGENVDAEVHQTNALIAELTKVYRSLTQRYDQVQQQQLRWVEGGWRPPSPRQPSRRSFTHA